MSEEEGKKDGNGVFLEALNLMRFFGNKAAEGDAYGCGWGADYFKKSVSEAFGDIRGHFRYGTEQFWREVFALPDEMKSVLGFCKFDKEDTKMCIPIWIWQCLPDDMEFEGKPKRELDNDIRFGCVWWKA